MKYLIIQMSPQHTASTFLVNALYGMIPELQNKKIKGIWDKDFDEYFDNIIVIKAHDGDIGDLIRLYRKKYILLGFICSERKDRNLFIDEKYKCHKRIITFDFNELNETPENSIEQIIDVIHDRIKSVFPNLVLDKEKGIERINKMNQKYEEIKDKPFSYIDDFFEIHGSHRNRINDA